MVGQCGLPAWYHMKHEVAYLGVFILEIGTTLAMYRKVQKGSLHNDH